MATLVTWQARLDALEAALASGSLKVRYESGAGTVREVTYRSVEELRAAISYVESKIRGLEGAVTLRQIRVNTRKGFC